MKRHLPIGIRIISNSAYNANGEQIECWIEFYHSLKSKTLCHEKLHRKTLCVDHKKIRNLSVPSGFEFYFRKDNKIMSSNVILTGKVSLGIQFAVGVADVYALTLPRTQEVLLRDLLKLELAVQSVEFVFYVWMIRSWGTQGLKSITRMRYYDWMLTTPTMLITLMAFLGGSETQTLESFIQEHREFIPQVLVLNWMMLALGLAGETGQLSQHVSVVLGFVPFVVYFWMIYNRFIRDRSIDRLKVQLYVYFFVIWSLYGIFALLPDSPKNIGYNILDLFSKNLLGVLLSVLLYIRPVS